MEHFRVLEGVFPFLKHIRIIQNANETHTVKTQQIKNVANKICDEDICFNVSHFELEFGAILQ